MDAAYYAIGRKWKKSLDILPKRASMSESHYVPASKKVKCRQTIEKGSTTGGLRPYRTWQSSSGSFAGLILDLPLSFQKKRWSHTSRVLCSGIPFVTWNLCKNSHQVPEMILKGRERILWVEFPKSAIVTKPKIVPYEMNSWFESLLLARYIRKFLISFTYTAKRKLERLQFSASSSFVKIWSACSCEFKAYFWTFWALYHLLFDLETIEVN